MSLPAPNLDDRRYQDLVDDAKRHVQRRCPSWTSHNVSDPGVTLIETFAYMVDQVLYRLNRVPDRLYVKFMELIGVRMLPGRAARAPVTFWLAKPASGPTEVPDGSEVATVRTTTQESISFWTTAPLVVVPCAFRAAVPLDGSGEPAGPVVTTFADGAELRCFSEVPNPDESLAIGLDAATPSCAVRLHVEASIAGLGITPGDPPIVWEASTPDGWAECELDRSRSDDIWGLNRAGDLVLHVPASHGESTIAGVRAAWLRCRVLPARSGQASYTASPSVRALSVATIGGTVDAVHATEIVDETLGTSDGTEGQRFSLSRGPVVDDGEPIVVDVRRPVKGSEDAASVTPDAGAPAQAGWEEWTGVGHFAHSSPSDRHVVLDAAAGEVCFGPIVRLADGRLRRYGARPVHGSVLRIRRYRVGGGRRGNVDAGTITRLKSAIPGIDSIENRARAHGGADPETIDEAKRRAPLMLHARDRAVTAEDFEHIARQAASSIARARCVAVDPESAADAPGVRVLVVPKAPRHGVPVTSRDLAIDDITLEQVRSAIDSRRIIGTRALVQPPRYQPIIVLARVSPRLSADPGELERAALAALHAFFNPLTGGPDGSGWPFGRPVTAGDAYAVLQQVSGVRVVEEIRLVALDPATGQPQDHTQRIDIGAHDLIVSADHQVKIELD